MSGWGYPDNLDNTFAGGCGMAFNYQWLFPLALPMAVYLQAEELKAQGGPSEGDFENLGGVALLIAEHGDLLLERSKASNRGHKRTIDKDKIHTADVFNQVARAVAVLSFNPGGVTLFGQHFETKL